MATAIAVCIYANFFTHHFIGDLRWYLAACALGLYARTSANFRLGRTAEETLATR
jgi:uncharacterized membrane protein YoaT (DUF817 family)